MIIELFILIQILAFTAFGISWFKGNPIMWSISLILFALLSFASFNILFSYIYIENGIPILIQASHSSTIAYLNIGFFMISLVMFFVDIYKERF